MPSEHLQSQSQTRPALGDHTPPDSINGQTDSPSTTPPQHGKPKTQKHVVGGSRVHTRVPPSKGMHKLTKVHGNGGSHENLKKLGRNASATHLKKNSSHVSLKRNRSSTDVPKRPKSSSEHIKRPTSVHFEIGDQEDAWEEASSSASPALSRSASRPSSAKQSADNSQPQSPQLLSFKQQPAPTNGTNNKPSTRQTADAKVITERLLQRTPSHNTTKMSMATATPATSTGRSPDSFGKSQGLSMVGTPNIGSKEEIVSRFVAGSGTPSDHQFLHNHANSESYLQGQDDMKRAQSMGNLARRDSEQDYEESALAPRSRKSSMTHAYNPPQQSRTQQKLWLQRASSNIEPQEMASGAAMAGLHGGLGTPLVGAGYDGRDPRIKLQLERTGLEYLVVRRHQDPVAQAFKRLSNLPGADANRRIPGHSFKKSDLSNGSRLGLSQSLKDSRRRESNPAANGARSSFETPSEIGMSGRTEADDDGISSILRSLWEKNLDLSSSSSAD